jgi:CRP/FNR family transcriptional regulator, cyclic AMP receptor protein
VSDKGLIKTFNIPYVVEPLAISIMSLANSAGSRGAWSRRSCVAPFPEPSLAAATCEPFLNLGFALEAGDVLNFGARAVGADLPFIFPIYWVQKGSWEAFRPCGIARAHYATSKSPTTGPSQLFTWGIGIAIIACVPPPLSGERSALAEEEKGVVVKKRDKASFDPKIFLAKVGDGKTISKYRKDQIIFSQGEVADAVFYIQQGKVKLTVVSEQGKEAVVAILGPGHFFGEGCLNGHSLRIATTMAIDECVITRLEKATMIETIHNEPEFCELFMSYLLSRNSRIEEDLIDQLFNSSEKRLARLPLLLANFGKEGRPEPIVGKFGQETLAEMIGTTRSRVSFFMNKFRKLGFIEYNGKIEVHNSLLNVILYDKPEIKTRDVSKLARLFSIECDRRACRGC